jgi:hypothetical protein
MYNKRINDWNIHKNYKKPEKAAMVRALKIDKASSKALLQRDHVLAHDITSPSHTFKGRPVKIDRLIRYLKETASLNSDPRPAFGGVAEPTRLITEYGENKYAETLFKCTSQHLEFYLASKSTLHPSTSTKPPLGVATGSLTNEQGLPGKLHTVLGNFFEKYETVMRLQSHGRISAAFRICNEVMDSVRFLFLQQHPSLISFFFHLLLVTRRAKAEFMQSIWNFVINMGKTVLGSSHPVVVACILMQTFTTDSSTILIWRALNDMLCNGLSVTDPCVKQAREWHWASLSYLGRSEEALEDINRLSAKKEISEYSYLGWHSTLLVHLQRCDEAELELRKVIDMTQIRDDVLTTRRSQHLDRGTAMVALAIVLERQGRYVEAKEQWLEILSFSCRVFGLLDDRTLENVSCFENYLQREARYEEAAALRCQYPHVFQ